MADPTTGALCRFLEWDSRHFGHRIGRVNPSELSTELLREIQRWCREHKIELLYFLANPNNWETTRLTAQHGFELVDLRLTLGTELHGARPVPEPEPEVSIRPAQAADVPGLTQMARRLHYDSRFFFDARFERAKSEQLFEIWMERSCADETGCVLVAEWHGKPAGYVTCHRRAADAGQIELLGVDEPARGRGLGKQLMSSAMEWFSARQLRRVCVVTQGRNYSAQRLYQRAGFATLSLELWYHRWLNPAGELPTL
jgi:dTDP-4-amino-4,6-dideoxy-D-galactose acyltransferase